MGHSSWKCPNSLHLKHLLLSLFIGLPETLECLVLGLLSNLPKGLLDLNDPLLPNLLYVSSVEASKASIPSIVAFIKVSFEFSSGLSQEGLKGFLYWFTFKVYSIQGFSKMVDLFFQRGFFYGLTRGPKRSP